MPESNGPEIQPRVLPLGGESIQVVADAHPAEFPLGLKVAVYVPGELAPRGDVLVPSGCMIAIVPPGMSENLRRALVKAIAQAQRAKDPGKASPPGVKPV